MIEIIIAAVAGAASGGIGMNVWNRWNAPDRVRARTAQRILDDMEALKGGKVGSAMAVGNAASTAHLISQIKDEAPSLS
jgi:hypothetical protein